MFNFSRKYFVAAFFLRAMTLLYVTTLSVFAVLLPVTQQTTESFIEDVRDILCFYACVALIHYLIRYDVMPSDKNLSKLPAKVKRNILVLFSLSILWMMLVVTVSHCFQITLTCVPAFVMWFAKAAYYIPFLFQRLITGKDRVELKRCASWVVGLECIVAAIMLICTGYIWWSYFRKAMTDNVVVRKSCELPRAAIRHRDVSAPCCGLKVPIEVECARDAGVGAAKSRLFAKSTSSKHMTSEKNQIMDALLNQSQIPSDYGETMVALFRDQSQDVLTRDFAVQHIGLYAQALERRGEYAPDSADARECRAALFEAAGDTRTIVAAAAFRALADIANFDSRIDASRLDSLLVACAADASSAPASRSMAVQLCGERRVNAARPALEAICADSSSPEILRRSASRSLAAINGH